MKKVKKKTFEAAFRDLGPTCARQIRGTGAGRTEPLLRASAPGASPLAVLDERPSGRSVTSGTRVACSVVFSLAAVTNPHLAPKCRGQRGSLLPPRSQAGQGKRCRSHRGIRAEPAFSEGGL